jgi:hypothetical protein
MYNGFAHAAANYSPKYERITVVLKSCTALPHAARCDVSHALTVGRKITIATKQIVVNTHAVMADLENKSDMLERIRYQIGVSMEGE